MCTYKDDRLWTRALTEIHAVIHRVQVPALFHAVGGHFSEGGGCFRVVPEERTTRQRRGRTAIANLPQGQQHPDGRGCGWTSTWSNAHYNYRYALILTKYGVSWEHSTVVPGCLPPVLRDPVDSFRVTKPSRPQILQISF